MKYCIRNFISFVYIIVSFPNAQYVAKTVTILIISISCIMHISEFCSLIFYFCTVCTGIRLFYLCLTRLILCIICKYLFSCINLLL